MTTPSDPATEPPPNDTAQPEIPTGSPSFDPMSIERPVPALLRYYVFASLMGGPFFPFIILPLYFKYITLKYKFDDSGISMSWGIMFRREIHLTYRRIQDIHLTRNLIQRWMGLATVGVQTASGSATPEMSIEGILEAEELRDFLYKKMRGSRGEDEEDDEAGGGAAGANAREDEALALLREIRDSLRSIGDREPV